MTIFEMVNKVFLGDCLDILPNIPDNSIDLIWFSPPYWNIHKYTNSDKEIGFNQSLEEYINSMIKIAEESKRILKDTGNFVINIMDLVRNNRPVLLSHYFIEKFPLIYIQGIIWYISNKAPVSSNRRFVNKFEWILHFAKTDNYYFNKDIVRIPSKWAEIDKRKWKYNKKGKCPGNVWFIPALRIPNSIHKAAFPQELCRKIIKCFSKEKDIVLDPMAGIGNTIIAARNLDRNYIGIELSEKYYKKIIDNLKQEKFDF